HRSPSLGRSRPTRLAIDASLPVARTITGTNGSGMDGPTRAFRESISSLRYDSPIARPCWWTGVGLHHPMGTTLTREPIARGTVPRSPESESPLPAHGET